MRPLSINRQSSARPITSRKKGLSRWSRRRRTTLIDPNTIEGPGALILVASCVTILTIARQSLAAKSFDFTIVKPDLGAQGEAPSVRISWALSVASPMRSAPARAESRDATERSRAGSRSPAARWRPAQADGGRSEGARPCLRARAASSRHFTRPRRSSAARRGFVTVGDPHRVAARSRLAGECWLADASRRGAVVASLTPVQTLPFWGKENSVPLKENEDSFS
jgi:hypothetical protein